MTLYEIFSFSSFLYKCINVFLLFIYLSHSRHKMRQKYLTVRVRLHLLQIIFKVSSMRKWINLYIPLQIINIEFLKIIKPLIVLLIFKYHAYLERYICHNQFNYTEETAKVIQID